MDINIINKIITSGVLLIHVVFVVTLIFYFSSKEFRAHVQNFAHGYGMWIGLFLSLASMLLSLLYSDGVGYAPCTLCWYSRIVMYPQALLFVIALVKKDSGVWKYIIWLSAIGILISVNHIFTELGASSLIPCSTGVSCAKVYVREYGYITIPVMALTGFVINFFTALIENKKLSTAGTF